MGDAAAALKTLIVPAVISLVLFGLSTFVLVPLWRRYRNRYSQYIPVDTISTHTLSLRARLQGGLVRWLVPSNWRRGVMVADDGTSDVDFSSDDGEELDIVMDDDGRHIVSLGARNDNGDSTGRLSRDLEQGFRDDSDDDNDTGTR